MGTIKDKILLSACALFSQKGYKATSVRDIAKDSQVNSAMINYYFHSKERLLLEIVQDIEKAVSETVFILNSEARDRDSTLCHFISSTCRVLKVNGNARLFIQLSLFEVSTPVTRAYKRLLARHFMRFKIIIFTFDSGLNSKDLKYMYGSIMGMLFKSALDNESVEERKLVFFMQLMLEGIRLQREIYNDGVA